MLAKNLPLRQSWWKIPFRILLDILSAIKGLLSGDPGYFVSIFKAHFSFFNWLLFKEKRKTKTWNKRVQLKGIYNGNVVWQHFAKKKTRFSEIIMAE